LLSDVGAIGDGDGGGGGAAPMASENPCM